MINGSTRTKSIYILVALLACSTIPTHAMQQAQSTPWWKNWKVVTALGLASVAAYAMYTLWSVQDPDEELFRGIEDGNPQPEHELFRGIENGDPQRVQRAIKAGAHVNEEIYAPGTRHDGMVPLGLAFEKWRAEPSRWKTDSIITFLLNAGANPNKILSSDGWTALYIATHYLNIKLMKLLLEKGAAVDATMPDGNTALNSAVKSKSVAAVMLLLEYGASKIDRSAYARESRGITPEAKTIRILLRIAGVTQLPDTEDLGEFIANLTPEERARTLQMMQGRWKHMKKPPTSDQLQLLATLGDPTAQKIIKTLKDQLAKKLPLPEEIVDRIINESNPFYRAKEEEAEKYEAEQKLKAAEQKLKEEEDE